MDFGDFFFDTEGHIKREKQRAKELRKTQWWKNKCQKGICYYCGKNVGASNLTMDHVVPLSKGGKSEKNNIVPCCKECNTKKRDLLSFEWEGDK